LAEIQPQNHQNVKKTQFWQKVPGVNGLVEIHKVALLLRSHTVWHGFWPGCWLLEFESSEFKTLFTIGPFVNQNKNGTIAIMKRSREWRRALLKPNIPVTISTLAWQKIILSLWG